MISPANPTNNLYAWRQSPPQEGARWKKVRRRALLRAAQERARCAPRCRACRSTPAEEHLAKAQLLVRSDHQIAVALGDAQRRSRRAGAETLVASPPRHLAPDSSSRCVTVPPVASSTRVSAARAVREGVRMNSSQRADPQAPRAAEAERAVDVSRESCYLRSLSVGGLSTRLRAPKGAGSWRRR